MAYPKPNSAAAKLLADRILARRRLLHFTKLTHPRYSAGWVHDDICRRLERFSREVAEGKSPRLMLLMPPRHGKALLHSQVLPTPQGLRRHGDLVPGDLVYHPSGRAIRVLALSEESPQDLEVEFFDGERVRCHAAHEWTVYDRAGAKWRTVETQYLATQQLTSGKKGRARFQLPLYNAVEGSPQNLPVDPYFLGAWLGDGSSTQAVICGAREDLEHVTALCPYELGFHSVHKTTGVHYQGFRGVFTLLRGLGLLKTKHVPAQYLIASVEQRRRLLEGLVDTDGSVEPGTQRVRFRSGSQRLAEDVAALVRSLGYRASVDYTPTDTRARHIVGGESWCVQWTPHDGQGGGTLPRKRVTRIRERRRVGIKAVHHVEPGMGRCIEVDSPDGLYLVGETYITTHNSELASIRFPAWHLGQYPHHELINVGYNLDLPMGFSRKVREVFRDPQYQAIFPDAQLDPDSQSVEKWNTTKGGGFTAAGRGGGITGKGAHCLPAGTQVLTTDGQVDIAHLYRLKSKPLVQTPVGPRQILAMTRREASEGHYVLRFTSGATLQATGKHPLYLPDRGGYASVEELYGEAKSDGGLGVRVVRAAVPAPAVQPQQVDPVGVDGVLLQQGVQSGAPRGEECQAGGGGPQQGLHPLQENPRAEDLPGVLRGVSAQVFTDGLLRGDLRKCGALDPYAWDGELELQGRQFLQLVVQPSSQARAGEGCAVRGLRSDTESPRPEKQPGGESGHAVRDVSHRPPQVCYDTLAVVEYVCTGGVEVYDIQVEEAGCFFADSVLVGNCLIVDDPIKDQEEADSALVREKLWDWYQSTAYTRLAPGGGVLVIQCMTGDTPVALPNGGTVRLDAVRPGDMVATYRKGRLSEAAVAAVRSCGRDSVYRITTTSGKVVRANGRHPFLALHNGELKWVRTQALNTTHAIVAVKGSGVSGAELSALRMAAPNRPSAEGSAPSTMHSASGQTDTAHQAPLTPTSGSTFTVSPMTSTAGWLQLNMGLVPSVSALPTIRMYQKAGAENFASTTTTQQDVCAGSSAIRATLPSDILDLSPSHLPQQHISDFVLEGVVSVEPAGEEEVFDLQIADTANFIANGLVSHNTWWNDDDLAGRLQQAMALIGKEGAPEGIDDFEIIKYPALSLSYEYRDDFDPGNPGPIIRTDEPIDVANPPLGYSKHLTLLRPKDFCLHEDRYPTEALKRIRANLQPRIWSALYQQNPVPDEGMYFRKEYFRYQRQLPSPSGLRIYTAWDFAIGEKQANDWTVGATIMQDELDQLYVLEIFRMKGDSFQIVEAMLDVATRWGSMPGTGYLLGAEDGQIWRAIEPLFKKRMVERRQYLPYEVLRPMTDKMARARPLQGRMQQGRVIFPEEAAWRAQAEQELLRFPAGVHDDVVDALAWAVQLCMGKEPPQAYTPPPLKSWRDRLSESFAGSVSHMSS